MKSRRPVLLPSLAMALVAGHRFPSPFSFDFATKANPAGFAFQLIGNTCVDFEQRIDGDGDAGNTFTARTPRTPAKPRVAVCPQ